MEGDAAYGAVSDAGFALGVRSSVFGNSLKGVGRKMINKVKSQKLKVQPSPPAGGFGLAGKTTAQNLILLELTRGLAFIVWVVYHLGRLCLGLVIHPYRTVREIMRGRWFEPLVFVPTALLVWIFITGRLAAWVINVPDRYRDLIGIFYATLLFSLGLWQALLLYLAVRFWAGLKR